MIERRRYMGLTALPYDYEVEYLESPNGTYYGDTGWIETNVIPHSTDTLIIRASAFTRLNTSRFVFGAGFYNQSNSFTLNYNSLESNTWYYYYGGKLKQTDLFDTSDGQEHTIYFGNSYLGCDDDRHKVFMGNKVFDATGPLEFFAQGGTYPAKYRLHEATLLSESESERLHIIPVVVSNVGAFYDKVSKELFFSKRVQFIIGPRVH